MGLPLEEQEVTINLTRTDGICSLYSSDSTWITKMEKLVEKNPEQFKRVSVTKLGNTYEFPKRFISIRSKDRITDVTAEGKESFVERMKNARVD